MRFHLVGPAHFRACIDVFVVLSPAPSGHSSISLLCRIPTTEEEFVQPSVKITQFSLNSVDVKKLVFTETAVVRGAVAQ